MSTARSAPTLLTIGTCNRRAGIAVVVESFLQHHPGGRAFVCLVDRPNISMPALNLPADIFFADELPLPGGRRFLFQYEVFELCCALKPYALRHVFEQIKPTGLLYLDSDILVTQPFWHELEEGWATHPILLTPHLLHLPDELSPQRQLTLVRHGSYNGGFVALRQDEQSDRFLQWWANVLAHHCTFDPMNSEYVDQRWLDLASACCDRVKTLRDPGLNVAYWNLHERQLTIDDSGTWTVNRQPLKFFHFSGFDPHRLTDKAECQDTAALKLARLYGERLRAAGQEVFGRFSHGGAAYIDGTPIAPRHRDLILAEVRELAEISDPFSLPQSPAAQRTMEQLARTTAPLRLAERYRDIDKAMDLLQRLYRHPVMGLVWRLWCRFINPSLQPYLPPHARH